jgi:hypothetical protein
VARTELGDDAVIHRLLGDDEPVEVEHHQAIVFAVSSAGRRDLQAIGSVVVVDVALTSVSP